MGPDDNLYNKSYGIITEMKNSAKHRPKLTDCLSSDFISSCWPANGHATDESACIKYQQGPSGSSGSR